MKYNSKYNYYEYLTEKIKYEKNNTPKNNISNRNNNIIKQINSHANSNKNIDKFSHQINLNNSKDKANIKITNIYSNNNNFISNINNENYNLNFNNSFLKEKQNTNYNKFRKSKTSDKVNNYVLIGNKQNQNSKNKKIIIKQNSTNLKNYNSTINKSSKYNNSVFNQVLKYYTIKSESKTIQIEDLSSYLSPMKNILEMNNKNKFQENTINSLKINKNNDFNDYNRDNDESDDDNLEEQIKFVNNINFNKSEKQNDNIYELYNYQNNNNNINQNIVKNSVLNNNNIFHSQRNNKHSSIPFNIQTKQISNMNGKKKQNNTNNINNNVGGISDIDTQISTNNNINHENQNHQGFNQYRTRKMSLPKSGINLSSIQLKNKILLNILHKRKQNK